MIKYHFKYAHNTTLISFQTIYFDCFFNDIGLLYPLSPRLETILRLLEFKKIKKLTDLPQNLDNLNRILSPTSIVSLFNFLSNITIHPVIPNLYSILNIIIKSEFPNGINCYSKQQMETINNLLSTFFNVPYIQREKLSKKIRSNKDFLQINRGTYKHISQIDFTKYKFILIEYTSMITNELKSNSPLNANNIFFKLQLKNDFLDNDINIYLLNSLIIYFKIDIRYKQTKFGNISYF